MNVLKKPTTAMRMPHVLILMVIFTASVTLDFSEVVEIVQVIKHYILYFFGHLIYVFSTIKLSSLTFSQALSKSNEFCLDVNECQDGSNECHLNATCYNSVGNYSCECDIGFSGNGFHCQGEQF